MTTIRCAQVLENGRLVGPRHADDRRGSDHSRLRRRCRRHRPGLRRSDPGADGPAEQRVVRRGLRRRHSRAVGGGARRAGRARGHRCGADDHHRAPRGAQRGVRPGEGSARCGGRAPRPAGSSACTSRGRSSPRRARARTGPSACSIRRMRPSTCCSGIRRPGRCCSPSPSHLSATTPCDAIRRLVGEGIIVSVGHSDASAEQVWAAADAGATMTTHIFNAQRPFSHREPGVPGAVMSDERYFIGTIIDGQHVDAAAVKIVFAAAPGRVVGRHRRHRERGPAQPHTADVRRPAGRERRLRARAPARTGRSPGPGSSSTRGSGAWSPQGWTRRPCWRPAPRWPRGRCTAATSAGSPGRAGGPRVVGRRLVPPSRLDRRPRDRRSPPRAGRRYASMTIAMITGLRR